MSNIIEIHPILKKQLKKCGIDTQSESFNTEKFIKFVNKVSQYYFNLEQEHYILERSMEISSKELYDLNEKLEEAQEIASIGYWFYNKNEDKIIWSKQTFKIFGLDATSDQPKFNEIMNSIHDDDRENLEKLIENAFLKGEKYEVELRIKRFSDNAVRWLYAKGLPNIKNKQPVVAISGIVIDITERKLKDNMVKELNLQLVDAARRAGMSEVAASVLHNIGNILTSVMVSVFLLKEDTKNDTPQKLAQLRKMLDGLISDNEQGMLIKEYLRELSNKLDSEQKDIACELDNIESHLSHIKDIIVIQNSLSGISGVTENAKLSDIIEAALSMCFVDPESKGIHINKQLKYTELVIIDKNKLIQVLVNLLRNAKEALASSQSKDKVILIETRKSIENKQQLEIIIEDNGIGIPKEKHTEVFSLGFTTKKTGHGYGLHSSAVTINEMGGSIALHSEGINKGTRFTISLPITNIPETRLRE